MKFYAYFFAAATVALTLFSPAVRADMVVTKDGARLVGKVTKIDGTKITLSTGYAGDLSIKQSEVVSMEIDKPTFVRLQDGTVVQGTVAPAAADKVEIKGVTTAVTSSVQKIAATWAPGAIDPAILARQHKWSYEATLDITGQTGTSEQLGTAAGFRAVNTGPDDKLQLYTHYNRQRTDDAVSTDQFDVGIDYADNFSELNSWYVRDEGGYDRVNGVSSYNTAAAGFGHDFIKKPLHTLTGRLGLAYRYEDYIDPATDNVSDIGLDIGLHHEYSFAKSKLINDLTYLPAITNSRNYEIKHQSYYEIPLLDPRWKLRLGISNDYNSQPGSGFARLNTTYFTRLVLEWP